ncbi:death regulator Nedd2-like caspase [Xylocopa sonorina]|uniref:death regulator Nedd2-like caspase n=1 Tax=Xylocopa sonorina TaxID=1818115 RepID=UPI00403B3365
MNEKHREIIDSCYDDVVPNINMDNLWPKLLRNKVFNRDDVNVPDWERSLKNETTIGDIYLTIKTRGPFAFNRFLLSLRESGHDNLADILEGNRVIKPNNDVETIPVIKEAGSEFFRNMQESEEPLQIQVQKATKFLDGPAYTNIQKYPMRSNPRGLVLIITNIVYKDLDPRKSAVHDESNLKELFKQMGFEVICHRNLTGQELLEKVKEFSELKQLRRADSCFIIISGHGNINTQYEVTEIKGVDYDSESKAYNYKTVLCRDILDYFTAEICPHLAGKPKIFVFQLCRGEKVQKSVKEPRHTTDISNFNSSNMMNDIRINGKETMRNYADMLVVHATLPGHVAFRDKVTGSWFIQILCEVFMKYAHEIHLQDLLNMVDKRLEIQRTIREECQTLTVTSIGFNKHCYLNPGLFEET